MNETNQANKSERKVSGLLAEYATPQELILAARKIRDAGFQRWDTYTPFPVHGIDEAMGIRPTILPWFVLGAGMTGFVCAVLLQWWTNSVDYPWIVSGKPFWSVPANVPIMFEMTVLFSALTTLVGMLMLNRLPEPSHPLDLSARFARSTDDRFFLFVEAIDPKFELGGTSELLAATHPLHQEELPLDESPESIPRVITLGMTVLTVAALVPFALIAYARATPSTQTRIHLIQDMDAQPKFKSQSPNPFFADGRSTRTQLPGTVAVGELNEDDHLYRGKLPDGTYATTFPVQVPTDKVTMDRGQDRFNIYCLPCHGAGGKGDGSVARRADELAQGTWVPPTNLTQQYLREMPVGQLFNTVTHGIRNMPAYAAQIPVEDRWAILLYVRALQRGQNGTLADIPEAARGAVK